MVKPRRNGLGFTMQRESEAMIEYLQTYGIWGVSGPILAVIVPAIVYCIRKGI